MEIDPYCRKVLEKHWPDVPRFDDVTKFCRRIYDCEPENEDGDVWCPRCDMEFGECECIGTDQLLDECGGVDVLAAGFPCQPVSGAGKKKVQDDERWLWPETARVIRELRPGIVLVENVPGLLARGMSDVLGDLARCGYDAEWDSIPAAAFGAPHLRERVFLVSYPAGEGPQGKEPEGRIWGRGLLAQRDWWPAEPAVHRVGTRVPNRVDRTRAIGNAVVPQVAEWIGRRIIESVSSAVRVR